MKRLLTTLSLLSLLFVPLTSYAAIAFNGTNQFMTSVANTGITVVAPRSVSAWVKTAPTIYNGPGGADGAPVMWFGGATDAQLNLITLDGNILNFYGFNRDVHGTVSLALSTWYFITMTYDGTNVRLYVNGKLDVGPTAEALNTPNSTVIIGSYSGWNAFFRGTIDDLRLYNRTLSAAEIRTLYLGGHMNNYGLIGWWPMWGLGNMEIDISGKRNNATPSNFTLIPRQSRGPGTYGMWW